MNQTERMLREGRFRINFIRKKGVEWALVRLNRMMESVLFRTPVGGHPELPGFWWIKGSQWQSVEEASPKRLLAIPGNRMSPYCSSSNIDAAYLKKLGEKIEKQGQSARRSVFHFRPPWVSRQPGSPENVRPATKCTSSQHCRRSAL